MKKSKRHIGLLMLLAAFLMLTGCHYPEPDYSGWDLTQEQRDSMEFRATHHYGVNYNFKVLADSLPLRQMLRSDSLWIYRDDVLVVADYARMTSPNSTDAIWIKVARDQETMGWILEDRLLDNVVPVDPVSRFIHWFSSQRTLFFLIIGGAFVLLYLYRRKRIRISRSVRSPRIDSIYPALLCCSIVLSATLYAGMQRFVPDTWVHYYFNPTLNPLGLPLCLSLFVVSVWAMLLIALALVDDLFHQADFSTGFFYLLGLGTLCMFLYLLVTWTVYYYVGYLFASVFLYTAIRYLARYFRPTYMCGHCGTRLWRKGICPHCGYDNK